MVQSKSINDSLSIRRSKGINQVTVNKKPDSNNLIDADSQSIQNKLFETGLVAYFSLSSDLNIIDANTTFANYLGYSIEEIINCWIGKYMNKNDIQDIKDRLNFTSEEIIILSYILVRKDGNKMTFQLNGKSFKNEESGVFYYLFVATDISNEIKSNEQLKIHNLNLKLKDDLISNKELEQKKQNEDYVIVNKRLEESNRKIKKINKYLSDKQAHLDSIMKTVPVSVGLVSERIILFANKYTSLMTGYEIEEIIGHDASFLYPNTDEYNRVYEILYKDNSEGSIKSVNTIWKMKNGTLIDVYITVTNIDIESPSKGYTFSALDVSAQRLYEEELIKAKDSAEKAEKLKSIFLANISHELRTPMNGIVGFAELLQNQVNQNSKDRYLKIIVNSSKQLLKIITDIVDISKIETGEIEIFKTPLSINKVLKEYYDYYRDYLDNRNKLSVELKYKSCFNENNDKISVDENKFKQVLTNILNNAVKFTESGSIFFGCELKGNYTEFYVKDTGIGIDAEEKETIFECFRKTESAKRKIYGGTGLGLAIAKGFVEAMDGKMWVESEQDKGATFYYTIPYVPIKEQIMEEPEEKYKSIDWTNFHILVVEDDMACLALINELLEETKIKISNAMTGLEAVKICRKDNSVDFVLMDMRLPEMDGYEATQRIKEFRPNLPIVAQTAHALSDDRKKCLAAGCDEYLTKPIIQNKLFDTISKYMVKS